MHDNNTLKALLEKEAALLTELNSLSHLKKDALMKDDLDSLETIIRKEEVLSGKLKTIDNACSPQVRFFLKGTVDIPEEFKELIAELRCLVRELKMNNDFNQALIRDSLSIIQFTLNALWGSNDTGLGVYGSSGKTAQASHNRSMLDCKR